MPKTRAMQNRAIRQEALRQQLAAQGHHQHIVELQEKLAQLDEDLDANAIRRLQIVIDSKQKIVDKYLPSPKQIEISEGDQLADLTDDELDSAIKELI